VNDTAVHLSVVIPAFNEEPRLRKTVERISDYLGQRTYVSEIIVVDDGSSDGTVRVAEECASARGRVRIVLNGTNRGKGYSVRHGVEEARGDYVLFSDADLSTPIEDLEMLFPKLTAEGYDIAIGSRALVESNVRVHQPWYRELMGKIFNKIVRTFTVRGIQDTQCGFKLFKAGIARELFSMQRVERFSFDVEVLFLARKRGYRIAEVPVTWYNSPRSRVSLLGDPFRMFLDVLKIRCYDMKGHYPPRARSG